MCHPDLCGAKERAHVATVVKLPSKPMEYFLVTGSLLRSPETMQTVSSSSLVKMMLKLLLHLNLSLKHTQVILKMMLELSLLSGQELKLILETSLF
jgi:hypothetical protein